MSKNKKTDEPRSRNVELVQQTQFINLINLKKKLKQLVDKGTILEYAYIIHNKDTKIDDNDQEVKKEEHVHCVMKLNNSYKLQTVANWFNVEMQYIAKVHNLDSAYLYLTHLNAPYKFQYPFDDVTSTFDYKRKIDIIQKISLENDKEKRATRLDEIEKQIDKQIITRSNLANHITLYENMIFKSQINALLETKEKQLDNLTKMPAFNIDKYNVYIYGPSGIGKSTFAKFLIYSFLEAHGYKLFEWHRACSSKDIMCGYERQPVIYLDEMREIEDLDYTGLLGLLHNRDVSEIGSRFKNKLALSEFNVISSNNDLDAYIKSYIAEEKDQKQAYQTIRRRIRVVYKFIDRTPNEEDFLKKEIDIEFIYTDEHGNLTKHGIMNYADIYNSPKFKKFNPIEKLKESNSYEIMQDILTFNNDDIPVRLLDKVDKEISNSSFAKRRNLISNVPEDISMKLDDAEWTLGDTKDVNSHQKNNVDKAIQDFIDGKSDELPF